MSTISELQEAAFRQSAEKGFHDDEPAEGTVERDWRNSQLLALMHSEISEALEELRKGVPVSHTYYSAELDAYAPYALKSPAKPEGVPSELADVVIRVFDFCGLNGIDLETIIEEKLAYNASRAHKHGGKAF